VTKNILSLFVIVFALSGCGIPLPLQKDLVVKDINAVRQFTTTNSVFNSYVAAFEQYGKVHTGDGRFSVGDIPINFGDTENENFQGVCFEYPDGTKEVIIRESWWNGASEEYRESLLFHELGHCRLDRDHIDDAVMTSSNRSYKISLMSSIIVGPGDYSQYKSEYLTELFSQNTDELLLSLGLAVSQ